MAKRVADDVSELRGVMSQAHGRGTRSPLYRWMHARHDELLDVLARPRWEAVAEFLASKGIMDGYGKPPTPERTRATWYRVRQDVDNARRGKEAKPTRVAAPGEIAPGVRAVAPTEPQPGRAERPRVKVELRPAVPLDAIPPASILEQPRRAAQDEAKDTSHAAEAEERIKAVLDELGGRRRLGNKMPKQVE